MFNLKQDQPIIWQQLWKLGTQELNRAGVPSPAVDAKYLLEELAGTRLELAAMPTAAQITQFQNLLERRKNREPLQHILGKMWFYGLELAAGPEVFSVRPETELLAEAAIKFLDSIPQRTDGEPKIALDLCTGSGAIALAMATNISSPVNIYAVELVPETAQITARNIEKYAANIELIVGDALTVLPELNGKVDLVVSNPPYVPPTHELSPEVRCDPEIALFGGGEDGLDFPRKLIPRAFTLLRSGGVFLMEHADEQGAQTREIAHRAGFIAAETKQDLNGRDRWLLAYKQ